MNVRRHAGFTLIEVLIVVVTVAILAAAVIPQFSSSAKDSQEASLKLNLQSLRKYVQLYKAQHFEKVPNGSSNLVQLTSATDSTGAVSSNGEVDGTHPFGPYVQSIPPQHFSGSTTVRLVLGSMGTVPAATAAPGGGWVYRITTGEIWIDHPDYVNW